MFEYGAPGDDLLPTTLVQQAVNDRMLMSDAACSLQYGPTLGSLEFRESLASFLSSRYGNLVQPSHLAITNGATQSFSK